MFVLAGCAGPETLPQDIDDTPVETGVFTGNHAVDPFSEDVLRVRQIDALSVTIRDADSPTAVPQIPDALRLNLFADTTYDARLVRVDQQRSSLVWVGEIVGMSGSEVQLAVHEDVVSGVVRVDDRLFTIQPRAGGPYIIEWDTAASPDDAPSILPDAPLVPATAGDPSTGSDADATVDVLVLYTGEAASVAGGRDALLTTIDLAVEQANNTYDASGVSAHIALLDARQTTYDETDLDFGETLARVADPSDGIMDEAHTLRDALGADHVVLIIDHAGPYAGLAYQLTAGNAGYFERFAFSVVSRDYAAGHFTFAHELGHNMGANHDPTNAPDGGYRLDSTGHQVPNAEYRTIMAYGCADGRSCPRVGLWSNPGRSHAGAPTGVAGVSDNASTLNVAAGLTATFRERTAPPTPPPAPPVVPAELTSPSSGATLPAGPVHFEWTDVSADAHRLMIGQRPGSAEYVNQLLGPETSFVVNRLPEGGETIHVRLWTQIGGDWVKTDQVYTAHDLDVFRPAELVFPGEELPGSWAFFAWDQSPGARRYRLEVGTDDDPTRYFQTVETEDFALVLGLPVDGSRVVARLMTEGPDGWVTRRTEHRAFTAPDYAATFTSPSSGSRLGGVSVTFRWTSTDADRHWIVIGDQDGILTTLGAEGHSARVYGLPRDGRELYAVLYSHGDEGWASTTAAFLASR